MWNIRDEETFNRKDDLFRFLHRVVESLGSHKTLEHLTTTGAEIQKKEGHHLT